MLRHLQKTIVTQSSVSSMQGNKTLSRQRKSLSRQHIHAIVRNSVVTKVEKNHQSLSQHRKECCNKVEELEEEIM